MTKFKKIPCGCSLCSGYCACGIAGHHDEQAVADPSLNPQVDNHLNNEAREAIVSIVSQWNGEPVLPLSQIDAILNIINQEKARLVDRIEDEVIGEIASKLVTESGKYVNVLYKKGMIETATNMASTQRTQLNRIKQEEGLK